MAVESILPLTMLLAAGSMAVTWIAARTLMAPVTFYWIGWLFGIFSAESMGGDGVFPAFSEYGRTIIARANLGAAIGFSAAAIMYRAVNDVTAAAAPGESRMPAWRLRINPLLVWTLIVVQGLFGIWMLRRAIADVQAIGGAVGLMDIRALYLDRAHMVGTMHPLTRIGSHLNLFWTIFPFLFGTADALEGRTNWRRVLVWWLVGIPAGLATGGRGWLITTPLVYGTSYLVTSGSWLHPRVRRLILSGAVTVVGIVALFGLIDRLRSWRYEETNPIAQQSDEFRWYDRFKPIKPVVFYMGIPALAAGPYGEYARTIEPYGGTLTASFLGAQLARFDMVEREALDFLVASRGEVLKGPDPLLGFTHATAVPLMIGDFGEWVLPLAMGFFCFGVQLAYFFLRRRGVVARLVSVHLLLYGGFWMFQDSILGTAGGVLPILWLLVFMLGDHIANLSGFTPRRLVSLETAGSGRGGLREVASAP